ncbi:hypothetical protein TNCV_3644761 [Trichonephila clavipes]|nr:hypothetical protein TNCV_3644761 [Trichonephila clavipes]
MGNDVELFLKPEINPSFKELVLSGPSLTEEGEEAFFNNTKPQNSPHQNPFNQTQRMPILQSPIDTSSILPNNSQHLSFTIEPYPSPILPFAPPHCRPPFQSRDKIFLEDWSEINRSCQVIYSQFGLAIHQNDHQARRRFVEWAQNEIAVVPDFHKRILFSDEAHFWLNGYVNKQNCRIWSEANPQVYVETPLHPEKLTVWCALWAGGILLQKR